MNRVELFSTPVWVTSIPASSYNKQELIDQISINYDKQPNRNNHSNFQSNMHNYYKDWSNDEFLSLDLDKLNNIYNTIINEFIGSIYFNKPIKYAYTIVNVTASRGGQTIDSHDHGSCDFVAVHYISLSEQHKSTIFENPTIFGHYGRTDEVLKSVFNDTHIQNSVYFSSFNIKSKEDDFVIFPSYLKHSVINDSVEDQLRITSSCNINIEGIQ